MAAQRTRTRKQTSANPTRKASANAAVTRKHKLPSKGRASKARILELTAELDSQMTDVHAACLKARPPDRSASLAAPPLGEDAASTATVRDLAEVLRGL